LVLLDRQALLVVVVAVLGQQAPLALLAPAVVLLVLLVLVAITFRVNTFGVDTIVKAI
jgi:hypothetical protein